MASPYASKRYAKAVAQAATPVSLQRAGGWLLRRRVGTTPWFDARACYPLFSCNDWEMLPDDLSSLDRDLVCVTAVIDPLHCARAETLRRAFPDMLKVYKMHYVADLGSDLLRSVSSHHRRNIKFALNEVEIEICAEPRAFAPDWLQLYATLTERHRVSGSADFSPHSLVQQLDLPGLTVLRATKDGATVGMTLWLANERHVYYHLGAYSDTGYACRASFGMFWVAIQHFGRLGLECINLGAGAGLRGDIEDGLSRFKQGWATHVLPAFLAGRVGGPARFSSLCNGARQEQDDYFPLYRAPGASFE
ncbi:hypothetical protein J2X90_003175 [Variovorax paradoxus]|uniref:GNAT family N-acetyltransferase n=1 Tax=Variovorax paradoxus TaxID=34073 RepID=UPI002787D6C4|nr:GNAT family N-acetyltransferase [Variovorax paradoxus]MDQ0025358.1 hypothetical protein [Variovorax paradoxus]